MNKKKAFISYNSRDRDAVSELVSILRNEGIECWFDGNEIGGGSDILEKINRALLEYESIVVCVGSHGLGRYQNFEVGAAFSLLAGETGPKLLIPVLLPGTSPSLIPPLLTSFSYINLKADSAITRLLSSLRGNSPSLIGKNWKYKAFYWSVWHEPYRLFLVTVGMAVITILGISFILSTQLIDRLFPETPDWITLDKENTEENSYEFTQIARTETTVEQYEACVKADVCNKQTIRTGCHSGEFFSSWPINCVTWEDASTYCKWINARLPSEVEWDTLSHTGDMQKNPLPLGHEEKYAHFQSHNVGISSANQVGQLMPNKWGLFDMYGNVWEWIEDSIKQDETRKIIKGGSAENTIQQIRDDPQDFKNYLGISPFIGFRCIR